MLKGIKIRLNPNQAQSAKLNSLLGSCRFVWNNCLDRAIKDYEERQLNNSLSTMSKQFHGELRQEFEWLQEHNTKVIKQTIIDLQVAYQRFFKHGNGFPKFKCKKDEESCRFPIEAISKDTFKNNKLNLTTDVKNLKFACSDRDRKYLLDNIGGIKSVTITKTKTNKYFASILVEGELTRVAPTPTRKSLGIDLGLISIATFSSGTKLENPKWVKKNEKKLKRLQRQHIRKEAGSKNREKARIKLAKKHEKIKNQKQDFLHNATTKAVNENQVITIEDLNVKGMMQNPNLAKAISEVSWGEFRRQIEYKAEWHNRNVLVVDRFFPSSKTCSCCKEKNTELKLSDRTFVCKNCGLVIDRDENASLVLEAEGDKLYDQLFLFHLNETKHEVKI